MELLSICQQSNLLMPTYVTVRSSSLSDNLLNGLIVKSVLDVCFIHIYPMIAITNYMPCLHLLMAPDFCSSAKVTNISHFKRYPTFVIAQGTWCLPLQKLPDVCHCKVPGVCHCKGYLMFAIARYLMFAIARYLVFAIAKATRYLPFHTWCNGSCCLPLVEVPNVCHW